MNIQLMPLTVYFALMQFGYEADESLIDFTLPVDPDMTLQTLRAAKGTGELKVYVGCTKWAEKRWIGRLYPRGTNDKEFLSEYAKQFNTIEFNSTFYAILKPEDVKKFADKADVNPAFKFCPKVPQNITHIRRLQNAEKLTADFYTSLIQLGDHLGPLLMQMGDNFTPKSFTNLKNYLEQMPKTILAFVEVRNKAWFDSSAEKKRLFELLQAERIGACISDTAGRRDVVHMQLPIPHAMVRYNGSDLSSIDYKRMDDWVERIANWRDQGLQSLWFFMHQKDETIAPLACAKFIAKLNSRLGIDVKAPTIVALSS